MQSPLKMPVPRTVLALALAALLSPALPAVAASGTAPQDLGASAPEIVQSISIYLKLHHSQELDQFILASVNPTSSAYHQFLSVPEFAERFGPSEEELALVLSTLKASGIVINEVYADHLVIKATGTLSQFNAAFNTSIHDYVDADGHKFRKPAREPEIPATLQSLILAVAGLNTTPAQFLSHRHSTADVSKLGVAPPALVLPRSGSTASGVPGSYTVGDVANFYGVNPLYAKGISGKGRTVGIATLANFLPSDAYFYWNSIGLPVKADRITQVHVDGGGVLSANAGSGETALDVEQSGGLAPDADVIVYDAPNTDYGFLDVFYKAASENKVDTLSVSWGQPEINYYPTPGFADYRSQLVAFHQAFAEAAAQGISLFAAAGDSGAFDTVRGAPTPQFTAPLTVDSPAADPYIVAAGGTTLPVTITFTGVPAPVIIPTEQVWGWDYLAPLFGQDAVFSVGGGGGVSVFWPKPAYQKGVGGIRKSEFNQTWAWYPNFPDTTGGLQTLVALPGGYAGRNVPDVSLNSDPFTGYILYSTPDGGFQSGYGGTSFAAPQLNGITSLLSQAAGSRLGLVQSGLYAAQKSSGPGIVDITAGDNWFYFGVKGYEPGAGLGVINAAKLVKVFSKKKED